MATTELAPEENVGVAKLLGKTMHDALELARAELALARQVTLPVAGLDAVAEALHSLRDKREALGQGGERGGRQFHVVRW